MSIGKRVLSVAAAVVLAGPGVARAEDPPFVGWPSLLPSLAVGFTPDTFTGECADGAPACVQDTLREMRERLAVLDARCDHNALFLRNYLTVTEHYAQLPPGFFDDDRYLAHEDRVFWRLWKDAYDAWAAGRRDQVPEAWRIAFDAGRDKAVQGAGDLLLGINAHVQRDMPYMLAGLGLVAPDGRSRKPDHDRFNAVLNASYDDVYGRAVKYDDPMMATYDPPGPLDGLAAFQIVAVWREGVWRNAERLVRARTPGERAAVARSIELQAATAARTIRALTAYFPPFFTSAARQRHCAVRQDPGGGSPPADLSGRDFVRADVGGLVRVRIRR